MQRDTYYSSHSCGNDGSKRSGGRCHLDLEIFEVMSKGVMISSNCIHLVWNLHLALEHYMTAQTDTRHHLYVGSGAVELWPSLAGGGQWPPPCCCSKGAKAWLWEREPAAAAHSKSFACPRTGNDKVQFHVWKLNGHGFLNVRCHVVHVVLLHTDAACDVLRQLDSTSSQHQNRVERTKWTQRDVCARWSMQPKT